MSAIQCSHFVRLLAVVVVVVAQTTVAFNETPTSVDENFTSYRLQVPDSNKSITIIEANTKTPPLTITPEHVQSLRERHHQQHQHEQNERLHQTAENAAPSIWNAASSSSSASLDDQYYYDRPARLHGADRNRDDAAATTAAKVNQRQHDYGSSADEATSDSRSSSASAAAASSSASPSSSSSSSSSTHDRHRHRQQQQQHLDYLGDRTATIALNVYDRDDDDDGDGGFIQPSLASSDDDHTFIKKRKVVVVAAKQSSTSSQHNRDDDDDHHRDDDDDASHDRRRNKTTTNKNAYSPLLLQQFIKTYTAKLKLGDAKNAAGSHPLTVEEEAAADRRYNWNEHKQQQPAAAANDEHNPFNEKKGWVTLEAVPWSASKVSKWHAHIDRHSASGTDRVDSPYPPHRPSSSSSSLYHYNDNNDDVVGDDDYAAGGYGHNRPHHNNQPAASPSRPQVYTTYNPYRPPLSTQPPATRRPTTTTSNKYQQATAGDLHYADPYQRPVASSLYNSNGGGGSNDDYFAAPEFEDNFQHHHQHQHRDRWYEESSTINRPHGGAWHDDIITQQTADYQPPSPHRPYAGGADFPSGHHQQQPPRSPRPHGHQQQPSSSSAYGQTDRFDTRHDAHHPDSGRGEWVLVSSNKGYQQPQPVVAGALPVRHGQRAIHMRPVGSADRKQQQTAQSPAGGVNDLVSHHSVRLTVLPPSAGGGDSGNTFSSDHRRRPSTMVLSHGGLLEVESSFDTVDNSVAAGGAFSTPSQHHHHQPQPATGVDSAVAAANKPPARRRVYKGVPLKSRTGSGPDASAVIAAVSAGMVPATMAMMVPIVLGKRKRRSAATPMSDGEDILVGGSRTWAVRRL